MIGSTHRLAGLALPLAVLGTMKVNEIGPGGVEGTVSALAHVNLLVLTIAPFLGNLPDFDQNEKNTSVPEILEAFKRQGFIEQSLRIILKKLSGGEHRGFTHSFAFLGLVGVILSPLLLIGFGIYDILFILLALASHMLIDMFNNTGARILWPISTKFNFLNIVPNIMQLRLSKKNQIRSKGWDLPLIFRLVGFIVIGAILFIYREYLFNFSGLVEIVGSAVCFSVMLYVAAKLVFVKTGSDEEKILWRYPLSAFVIGLFLFNYKELFIAYKTATGWLSNHPLILAGLIIFLAVRGVNIFKKDFKKILDTKQLGGFIASFIIIGSFLHIGNIIDGVGNLKPGELKENFKYENIAKGFGESVKKLSEETQSLINRKPINVTKEQIERRAIINLESYKNVDLSAKLSEFQKVHLGGGNNDGQKVDLSEGNNDGQKVNLGN